MKLILTEDAKDLNIGDEFVTNSSSELRCYKVLEKPRVSKLSPWHNGKTRYIAVKCRSKIVTKTRYWTNVRGVKQSYNYKTYNFESPDDNDPIVKVDLNYKQIIITNKQEEWM
jgi:hypothetical protein